MKTRHSPNLYEILRSASAPKEGAPGAAAAVAPTPPPAPPPPPAVAPALKVSEAHPSGPDPDPIVEAPPPPPLQVERPRVVRVSAVTFPAKEVETAPPAPAYEPPPADRPEPPAAAGLGERSLRVTYNSLLFAGLVVIGIVFLAFTLGVRTNRARTDAPPSAPELETATPQAPAAPARKFTIRLVEYRARTSQEYTKAWDAAIRYKNELERLGLRDAVVDTIVQAPDRRVVLRYGEYTDAAAGPARETLQKLKSLKLDKASKEATFSKTAQFQTM